MMNLELELEFDFGRAALSTGVEDVEYLNFQLNLLSIYFIQQTNVLDFGDTFSTNFYESKFRSIQNIKFCIKK